MEIFRYYNLEKLLERRENVVAHFNSEAKNHQTESKVSSKMKRVSRETLESEGESIE